VPGIKGLPAEVWGNIHTPADDLAAFHGYINLTTAWITGYRMEPSLKIFLERFSQEIAGAGRSRCSTHGRFAGLDDISDRFVRSICSNIEHDRSFFLGADPFEFAHVELDLFTFYELSQIQAVDGHKER